MRCAARPSGARRCHVWIRVLHRVCARVVQQRLSHDFWRGSAETSPKANKVEGCFSNLTCTTFDYGRGLVADAIRGTHSVIYSRRELGAGHLGLSASQVRSSFGCQVAAGACLNGGSETDKNIIGTFVVDKCDLGPRASPPAQNAPEAPAPAAGGLPPTHGMVMQTSIVIANAGTDALIGFRVLVGPNGDASYVSGAGAGQAHLPDPLFDTLKADVEAAKTVPIGPSSVSCAADHVPVSVFAAGYMKAAFKWGQVKKCRCVLPALRCSPRFFNLTPFLSRLVWAGRRSGSGRPGWRGASGFRPCTRS